MPLPRLFLRVACVLAVVALAVSEKPVFADTYLIYDLGIANSNSVVGIDTAGDVVIFGETFCGVFGPDCYKTYTGGVLASISNTLPPLSYDNGTACTPVVPGYSVGLARCNNGRFAFAGDPFDLYAGPNPVVLVQAGGAPDPILLNSVGDIAWTDGRNEENFEAIDLGPSVPEPGTIVLLTTGVLSLAGTVRRRLARRPA